MYYDKRFEKKTHEYLQVGLLNQRKEGFLEEVNLKWNVAG